MFIFYKKNEPNNHGLIFCLALLLRTSEHKHYFRVSGLVINQFSSLMFVIWTNQNPSLSNYWIHKKTNFTIPQWGSVGCWLISILCVNHYFGVLKISSNSSCRRIDQTGCRIIGVEITISKFVFKIVIKNAWKFWKNQMLRK